MLIALNLILSNKRPSDRNEDDFENHCLKLFNNLLARASENETILLLNPKIGPLSLEGYMWLVDKLKETKKAAKGVIIVDNNQRDTLELSRRRLVDVIDDSSEHNWPFELGRKGRRYSIGELALRKALTSCNGHGVIYRFNNEDSALDELAFDKDALISGASNEAANSLLESSQFINQLKVFSESKRSVNTHERVKQMIDSTSKTNRTRDLMFSLLEQAKQNVLTDDLNRESSF